MGDRHELDRHPGRRDGHVFVAVDHCNSECVGIHADKSANRFQAQPVRQGVRQHFGTIWNNVAAGLILRHDHGPNYMSDDFQSEIALRH